MDCGDGDESKAAELVVQHMVELGRLGKECIMSRAMAQLNGLAMRVVAR